MAPDIIAKSENYTIYPNLTPGEIVEKNFY